MTDNEWAASLREVHHSASSAEDRERERLRAVGGAFEERIFSLNDALNATRLVYRFVREISVRRGTQEGRVTSQHAFQLPSQFGEPTVEYGRVTFEADVGGHFKLQFGSTLLAEGSSEHLAQTHLDVLVEQVKLAVTTAIRERWLENSRRTSLDIVAVDSPSK